MGGKGLRGMRRGCLGRLRDGIGRDRRMKRGSGKGNGGGEGNAKGEWGMGRGNRKL